VKGPLPEDEKTCRICRCADEKVVRVCKCANSLSYFHLDCAAKWARISPKCELCKQAFDSKLLPPIPIWKVVNPSLGLWPLILSILVTSLLGSVTEILGIAELFLCLYNIFCMPHELLDSLESQIVYFVQTRVVNTLFLLLLTVILAQLESSALGVATAASRHDVTKTVVSVLGVSSWNSFIVGSFVFSATVLCEWADQWIGDSVDFGRLEDLLSIGEFQLD